MKQSRAQMTMTTALVHHRANLQLEKEQLMKSSERLLEVTGELLEIEEELTKLGYVDLPPTPPPPVKMGGPDVPPPDWHFNGNKPTPTTEERYDI